VRSVLGRLGSTTVDRVDLEQAGILLVTTGRANLARDMVAFAQAVLAGELERNVGVLLARQVAVDTKKSVALVAKIENA